MEGSVRIAFRAKASIHCLLTISSHTSGMENLPIDHFRIDIDHWPTLLGQVNADTLGGYTQFRRSLDANYKIVWRDIALGYLGLALTVVMVSSVPSLVGGLAAAVIGSLVIGYIVAYLQLFIHEAAHWNLARNRATSDLIANYLIAWQVGTTVAAYRKVHFDHHRFLGHEHDGERSYVHQLSWRFLIEMATGIHALRIFTSRSKSPKFGTNSNARSALVKGVVVHAILLAVLLATGAWAGALAWIGGMAIFFPIFATLRPLLEHRPCKSDSMILSPRGDAVTRMFADGFLARTFGGVGFSQHLLHHWEPQVSYTRLGDLDRYLASTSVGGIIEARRTTYLRAFREILASDNGR